MLPTLDRIQPSREETLQSSAKVALHQAELAEAQLGSEGGTCCAARRTAERSQ
jgi:hypothetical protein